MPDEPLDHVRRPDLPWRVSTLTECGRPVKDVGAYIERDELIARLKNMGSQRTALLTCMTCWGTSARWKTFTDDPEDAMRREIYARQGNTLAAELRAIAALVEKYRDEFDGYLAGLEETVSLQERRLAKRRAR